MHFFNRTIEARPDRKIEGANCSGTLGWRFLLKQVHDAKYTARGKCFPLTLHFCSTLYWPTDL